MASTAGPTQAKPLRAARRRADLGRACWAPRAARCSAHALDGVGAGLGALIGAALFAPLEVAGHGEPRPGAAQAAAQRASSPARCSWRCSAGCWAHLSAPATSWLVAIVSGALLGLLGLRPLKLALGLVVGAVVGLALRALDDSLEPALVAAAVTVAYRVVAAIVYRNRPLVRIMAEEVPAADLAYVVPFEARSRYVGADYVEQLAEVRGGTFRRNPPDVGILASLDALRGPTFDPGRVHPLIREFYEHTSRFKLSIVPEWRRWMKPGYEVFKRVVAEPLGQAAIPSNIEEAQRGMVSTIDTIDLDGDEVIDIRGWIRTFADSGKPIYVGIYTSFRHDERGYVSVGFPIPGSNFTATLEPRNEGASDLVLTSRSELPFPGHYLSSVDSERDALTVIKLLSFEERIHVFVRRRRAADRPQLLARRPALPDPPLRDRAARPHVVLMRPPSMTKFDPLTLAVRGEARSGHEGRDLARRREAAGGDAGDRLLAHAVGGDARRAPDGRGHAVVAQPQVGLHLARRDAGDADAARRELLRQRLGHVEQCGLGRAVVDDRAVGLEEGVDGGDVDDGALAARQSSRRRRPASRAAPRRS